MFDKILVVCVGNICRSPTAERMLRKLLPEKTIDSAGVGAVVGHGAKSEACEVANEHGLSLENHSARQLTPEICTEYDLILVMEKGHINAVMDISPVSRGKTMLLGHWLDDREIPDPYRKSREMYEITYDLIEKCANSWLEKLQ